MPYIFISQEFADKLISAKQAKVAEEERQRIKNTLALKEEEDRQEDILRRKKDPKCRASAGFIVEWAKKFSEDTYGSIALDVSECWGNAVPLYEERFSGELSHKCKYLLSLRRTSVDKEARLSFWSNMYEKNISLYDPLCVNWMIENIPQALIDTLSDSLRKDNGKEVLSFVERSIFK